MNRIDVGCCGWNPGPEQRDRATACSAWAAVTTVAGGAGTHRSAHLGPTPGTPGMTARAMR